MIIYPSRTRISDPRVNKASEPGSRSATLPHHHLLFWIQKSRIERGLQTHIIEKKNRFEQGRQFSKIYCNSGFIKGILRGVRCTNSLRVLFLHRRPPSWTTLVLYSRAVFIFNEPALTMLTYLKKCSSLWRPQSWRGPSAGVNVFHCKTKICSILRRNPFLVWK